MALIPYVIERAGNTERSYDLYSRLLTDRVVMLCEEVTDSLASVICAQLLYLDSQNPGSDISLYINSPGGSVSAGLAIYDTMNYISADVQTICMGMAASMGAFLLCSGTKGKRMCLPNSEVMIHQPLGGAQGQASDIRIQADHILRTKQRLTDIIAKNTGRTYEEVESACDRDNWLSPEAALDFGLIDKIIEKR